MTHLGPDLNPPAPIIGRINRTAAEVREHPETYQTRTLTAMLHASLELSETINRVLAARGAL